MHLNQIFIKRIALAAITLGIAVACAAQEVLPPGHPPIDPAPETQPALPTALSFELLYGDGDARIDFSGDVPRGLRWLPGADPAWFERIDGEPMRIDAVSSEQQPAWDVARFEAALAAHPDFDAKAAARIARRGGDRAASGRLSLLSHEGRLYRYSFATGRLETLTREAAERELAQLSPDGRYCSFVLHNDLYVIDADTGRTRRLTRDGAERVLNGKLDWVYQEEIYGRYNFRGHWWRDDGRCVAFLRLDEHDVPTFHLVNYIPLHSALETMLYPKVGDPLPPVRLGLADPRSGRVVWADLSAYRDDTILIVRVSFAPDGAALAMIQDRLQRWVDLVEIDPRSGRSRRLLRDETPAWTERPAELTWLADQSFLLCSARDGWMHVYHYDRDGSLRRRITRGAWEVRGIEHVDEAANRLYLTGTRDTSFESHLYAVPLDGSAPPTRLTAGGFSHAVSVDPSGRYFLDTASNLATPPRLTLCDAETGELVRVIAESDIPALDSLKLAQPELLTIPARDGYPLPAMMILPPDADPQTQYPVILSVYAGPMTPIVSNSWGGRGLMYLHLLAQQGFVVLEVDPRTAAGGQVDGWQAWKHLGERELQDLEDVIDWLDEQPFADAARVGIYGHSYGGFMTAYALTHSDRFAAGLAGAPVTDWRLYDAVYTERYMLTEKENKAGYEASSAVDAAAQLAGRLLVIHGLMDDNVHPQNTLRLAAALEKLDKPFEMMIYPTDRHGIFAGGKHYADLRIQFFERCLKPGND